MILRGQRNLAIARNFSFMENPAIGVWCCRCRHSNERITIDIVHHSRVVLPINLSLFVVPTLQNTKSVHPEVLDTNFSCNCDGVSDCSRQMFEGNFFSPLGDIWSWLSSRFRGHPNNNSKQHTANHLVLY